MGRIKKVATERHTATASPFVTDFVQQATSVLLHQLPATLDSFPQAWPYPRGDLYHWIPLLNRFDHILELFNKEYGLSNGPQQEPFECRLLQKGDAEDGLPYPSTGAEQKDLDSAGYSDEGDREVVESIVHFTRVLVEHCGNRTLYASSGQLDSLLHTTSLSLLRVVLRLSLRLAQRYQVARFKNNHPHAQSVVLANHYNFTIDRIQKLAQVFPKSPQAGPLPGQTSGKGKEKVTDILSYNPTDLKLIAKAPSLMPARWNLSAVNITYYDQPAPPSRPGSAHQPGDALPSTPTPIRRTSTLGPSRDRPSMGERSVTTGDVSTSSAPVISKEIDSSSSSAPKTFSIAGSKVAQTPAWALVKEALTTVPVEQWYETLTRIRIAKAFTNVEETGQQLLEVRLLAVANLAYALGESKFQEKIGIPDNEEPKRFHLAHQLCDLLQPASSNEAALSTETETAVLLTLEALSKIRHKCSEVADALQISHNHGLLYYELRRVIATLSMEQSVDKKIELQETEWRDATFDLTNTLLQPNTQARHGERMVSAGIMGVLIEALTLRTDRAERFHEKNLQFFDSFIHGIPTALQTLAGVKGLDILADLASYEVTSSLQLVKNGNGLPAEYKSKVVDYEIPFHQQATLRQLFKFTTHMFDHNAGTHDRLLRNLIDTPQVLGALRNVIENASVFGSNVWSGAVNIMSSFIHNEPTSFQVVGEAGLVKSLLQTIVPWELQDSDEDNAQNEDIPVPLEFKDGEIQFPTPLGILPVGETMCDIPTAFGAICLNESGMKLFRSSKALLKFMDIFVSPPHVRALEEEGQTAASIGTAFDELSRHHPQLKEQIMTTVITMVKRVGQVCRFMAEEKGNGAKLWERTPASFVVSGGRNALMGPFKATSDRTNASENAAVSEVDLGEDEKDRVGGMPFISACFKFLDGFFSHNTSMCSSFCEQGGAEYLLDLATAACNPHDICAFQMHTKMSQVLRLMCDAKPHLVLPSLLNRLRLALNAALPLVENKDSSGAFATFVDLSKPQISSLPSGSDGTTVVKALANIEFLTHTLQRAFSTPWTAAHRHPPQANQLFSTLNFTDVYIEIVDGLSRLHAACSWEELVLQKNLPEKLETKTQMEYTRFRRVEANGVVEIAELPRTEAQTNGNNSSNASADTDSTKMEDILAVKNVKTIRYLLWSVPNGINRFIGAFGSAIYPKRHAETMAKLQSTVVADTIARTLVWELDYKKFDTVDETMETRYLFRALTLLTSHALLKSASQMETYGQKEALVLVLYKFYLANGFDRLNLCLQRFSEVLEKNPADKTTDVYLASRDGLVAILAFYNAIVRSKLIHDAAQSAYITVKHTNHAEYFTPGQFVVEIRDAVLPAVVKLWKSAAIDYVGDSVAKLPIEIMRTILKGEGEDRPITRAEKATRRMPNAMLEYKLPQPDAVRNLRSSGYDIALAREALYRCNDNEHSAQEYCHLRKTDVSVPSFPVPKTDAGLPETADAQEPPTETLDEHIELSGSQLLHRQQSVEMTDAGSEPPDTSDAAVPQPPDPDSISVVSEDADLMSEGALPHGIHPDDLPSMLSGGAALLDFANGTVSDDLPSKDTHQPFVTIEDLEEKRQALRDGLIDRCLEVLSVQPDITFELSELIQAAVVKNDEGKTPRADVASTLVSSLLSLQAEEPSPEAGKKIAAYAHLVALILQDRGFFSSTLEELKGNLDSFVAWIQLGHDQKVEDAPWIGMILLIIERVLAEDELPVELDWRPPPTDDPLKALPEPVVSEPVVSSELRDTLFDAITALLPKIGKNASLALSVCRVLVTLTRRRAVAARLSEKNNMSGFFLMIRQLAGSVHEKLHSSIMIILRHMIEDERILRQIMETEIRTAFENQSHRADRRMDSNSYARNLSHLVLRDPELFIDVTKDMVEIARYDGAPLRGQALALKNKKPPVEQNGAQESTEAESVIQKSVEEPATDEQKTLEVKTPVVEASSGVVQFLLRELSNYRDVEDKARAPVKDAQTVSASSGTNGDVEMIDAPAAPNAPVTAAASDSAKTEKTPFKPEDHAIYIYRCFLMQCLAELLASYNRTKVEFINFSRKPDAQNATPSKPRAGTLNYLLTVLIPVGTLEHRDDIAHRKKLSTSHWATTVLVSLCQKTPEQPSRVPTIRVASEENPDLTFVRKFVLEHALRAFKDAIASVEPLDARYSRLLTLGELFNRMMNGKADRVSMSTADFNNSRDVGKLMYEKNFVGALTSAIAELDLNFPNAKRAVKYILGPLKMLTALGVILSQESDLSSSAGGVTDEDDISSATSISDDEDEDEREQTPDLYRNSTLGMFESNTGHDEGSESDSEEDEDEDEMYEEAFDEDEMDYEDGPIPDHDEVVSDEDEDIEGMGDIEGLPGDVEVDVDVIMNGSGEVESPSESDDDEDEDDDDEDEDDEDDDQDFADHMADMEEITGDDENASMPGHDEDHEWEEEDEEIEIFAGGDHEDGGSSHGGPLAPRGNPLDQIAQVIGVDGRSDPDGPGLIHIDMGDGEEDFFDDELPPEDDDEENEEVDYDNDIVFEPGLEEDDDEEGDEDEGWGWSVTPPDGLGVPLPPRFHHHHHHRHGIHDMLNMMQAGLPGDLERAGAFRNHHRPASTARGQDDGTNPLLQRDGGAGGSNRDREFAEQGIPRAAGFRRTILPRHGDGIMQDLVAAIGGADGGHALIREPTFGGMPQMFAAVRGGNMLVDFDPTRFRDQLNFPRFADLQSGRVVDARAPHGEEAQAVDFRPISTVMRWQEEARLLFGTKHQDRAARITSTLQRALIPLAMEAKRLQDKAEAERKAAEEKAKEIEKQKAEAEKAEREEKEKKEREEKEAEEARAREQAEREAAMAVAASEQSEAPVGEEAMEDVEPTQPAESSDSAPQEGAQPEQPPAERITTTIRGRELDITDLGIDVSFLESIPEELREEVIMGAVAERRSTQTQAGEQPSEISREFLEALPPDIQQELIRQEASDRRRRERAEARQRSAEDGNAQPAQAEEMNNADFMAMLDPNLRQAILMDADENTLASLPEEVQAEARNYRGEPRDPLARVARRMMEEEGRVYRGDHRFRADMLARPEAKQRRPVIQMLDKAGIATLLRLMFVSLNSKAKLNLQSILSDVCKNTQNRAEVISTLLSILQDGTADVSAVERSFAHLSLRAKQLAHQKTPQPLKRTPTGTVISAGAELSPLNIVQQCLGMLNTLTLDNPRVASFFLSEHETITSSKAKSSKKGKEREVRAAKFPLNSLLVLLDRKLVTENTSVMETLASLLNRVTQPLTILLRKAKETGEADKQDAEPNGESADPAPSAGSDVQMAEATAAGADVTQATDEQTSAAVEATDTATAEGSTAATKDQDSSSKSEEKKKHRELVPPEVPEENIRLVVNIITARECPGKTFIDTLDLIKQLSSIPHAKEVFGRELVRQAQELSEAVLVDLEDLSKQINTADTGTDLQGVALANFSTAASKQHKLLRVLVALDHIFDPKKAPAASTAATESSLKSDILATLYETSTFDKLWSNLSQCLTAIRQRGNMVNVAAILLPMIESLMVVCRNSALKDTALDPTSPAITSGTPPPEARLEALFFKFTEDHRKILNELIRNTPKLMNGNLAVLAKNSKVLEFDNKRSYFSRKLHTRTEGRQAHPSLQLSIRRDQVFLDSFKSLYYKTKEEIKYGRLNIRFHGEEGVDAGGVSREWFAAMARQMFNPDYALFNPVASDRTTFHPNPLSEINSEHLLFFKFIGRIIGKALYEGRVLDCHFSRAVYRRILGKSVSLKDMESVDLDYYKSLVWILENDITDITFETFSVDVDKFGLVETVDLIPNGRDISVTEDNKHEYVRLVVEHRLITSVKEQLEQFLQGFHDIIPRELISIFNEQELELLISGLPDIDVDDWKNNTEYHNYQATSPQIQWLWRAVRSFDKEEKAKLLQFVTGTSKVPLNGFKELEGMNGFAKFNIHRDYSSKEKLPSSHTCFNQLDLPEYESYEHLRQQLYTAITAGSEYFGFA